ncbi:hypothetical protein SAMN04487911_14120 [Arenibacter nanhaiticus]|uniref:Uncharacterized protein n=1 Tax=Arenibacter nanhaiticus TaxID=558155 RepID=A0A1M6MH12_9FLAO|nr:hypothetical protein [Arenibacter nanhaiticus]SHJ82630.1 hypothetical protein SAMN04487911_14120 [Arenibacter nanhaiticus]
MKLYQCVLEFLYRNREKGYSRITHICMDPNDATRIAREMKEKGLIDFKQRRFVGSNGELSFIAPPSLMIAPLGIDMIESQYPGQKSLRTKTNP